MSHDPIVKLGNPGGVLPLSAGGTGLKAPTDNNLLIGGGSQLGLLSPGAGGVLQSNGTSWEVKPGGKLLQAVYATTGTQVLVSTQNTWISTTLSVNITPKVADSWLYIIVRQSGLGRPESAAGLPSIGYLGIATNNAATPFVSYAHPYAYTGSSRYSNGIGSASIIWPVGAANTNPRSYSTQALTGGSPVFVQWNGATSSITVLEFAP